MNWQKYAEKSQTIVTITNIQIARMVERSKRCFLKMIKKFFKNKTF